MNRDFIAVIILNHNKKNDLLECIDSVLNQDYLYFEIIVVDNGSTDGSAEAVKEKFPSIHLIQNNFNSGAGPGRNTGWRALKNKNKYKYILFLDDDTIITKDFITKIISSFRNERAGIVCGKAFTDKSMKKIMSTGIRANLYTGAVYDIGSGKIDNGQYEQSGYVNACGTFALMIRADLFSKLGGFDEKFAPYGWEDVNLCLQAKKYGYYTYYNSNAVLIHKGTKLGRKPNPVYEKNKIKNYIYFLRINTNLLQKITCSVFLPFRAVALALKLIFNGNAVIIFQHLKGFLTGIYELKLSVKSNK